MRFVFVVVLVVLCGWLFSERQALTEKNASLTEQLDRNREKTSELEKKLAQLSPEQARIKAELANAKVSTTAEIDEARRLADEARKLAEAERARAEAALRQPKESWLKEHVEEGSRALNKPANAVNPPPFPSRSRLHGKSQTCRSRLCC